MSAAHSEAMRRRWADPGYRERISVAMGATFAAPGMKSACQERGASQKQDTSLCERIAESVAKSWRDPAIRKRKTESIRQAMARPETHEKLSASSKASWENPVARANRIAVMRAAWDRPERKAKAALPRGKRAERLRGIEVPKWVPADGADLYRATAARLGEEAAAAEARMRKTHGGSSPRWRIGGHGE